MMTRERIRYLLIHNKTIRSNIQRAKEIAIEMESDTDVIEAALMPAADYSRDRVQSGHEPSMLSMTRVRGERIQQRIDVGMRRFAIETQETEMEHLDYAVFSLPARPQEIIIDRFYDQLTLKEVCKKRNYAKRSVTRMTDKAIDEITEIFNAHGAESLLDPHNDLSVKVGPSCPLNL